MIVAGLSDGASVRDYSLFLRETVNSLERNHGCLVVGRRGEGRREDEGEGENEGRKGKNEQEGKMSGRKERMREREGENEEEGGRE